MTPWQRYQADRQEPAFVEDPAQEAVVRALQALHDELTAKPASPQRSGLLQRLGLRARREPLWPPVTGLYIWGGVGRGKTYLMDLFHETLPFAEKQRLHFHRFMQMVHQRLRELQQVQDPLAVVAREFARETRVLCFDEFFVADITDAMLLGGLMRNLFSEGVTLVATSNIPPRELYRDGLQRERFLPAIDLIEQHSRVLELAGDTDHRLRYLERAALYHWPLSADGDNGMETEFRQLVRQEPRFDTTITVEGRAIPVRGLADDAAWFDFDALCDGPRGQADYIELARCYHSVLLDNVPVLDTTRENQARRFIALVDEFYDHSVKLILAADAPPDRLYQGRRLAFEFERTLSRIQAMQSHEYLASAHRA